MTTPDPNYCTWVEIYALDGLSPTEAQEFEQHLGGCETCQRALAAYSQTTNALLHGAASEVAPPLGMKERVLTNVLGHSTTSADKPQAMPRGRDRAAKGSARPKAYLPWVVSAAMFLLTLYAFGRGAAPRQPLPPTSLGVVAKVANLTALNSWAAHGKAYVIKQSANRNVLMISFQGLHPTAPKNVYQVWFVKKNGVQSAGTFVPQPNGQAFFASVIPSHIKFSEIAVTLEPSAYDTQPRGTKVLAGNLT